VFDAISLWFCCAVRTAPEQFSLPGSRQTTFTPENAHDIRVTPWPFAEPELTLAVEGRRVSAARNEVSDAADQAGDAAAVRLDWRLLPG
jgi:hypothetical protein